MLSTRAWSLLNTFYFPDTVIVCVSVGTCEARGRLPGVGFVLPSWVLGIKLRFRLVQRVLLSRAAAP